MTERPVDQATSSEIERPGNATAKHDNVALLSVATTVAGPHLVVADPQAEVVDPEVDAVTA